MISTQTRERLAAWLPGPALYLICSTILLLQTGG